MMKMIVNVPDSIEDCKFNTGSFCFLTNKNCSSKASGLPKFCPYIRITEDEMSSFFITCEDCINFEENDRFCKTFQVRWLPENFNCNKGKHKNLLD